MPVNLRVEKSHAIRISQLHGHGHLQVVLVQIIKQGQLIKKLTSLLCIYAVTVANTASLGSSNLHGFRSLLGLK